ncbi:MAG TPA: metallophosphoesterase [Gemmatimonadaceae bacterium]|nr:metallophosphoesterase [Gemmatimonadaceae bacterium]
MSPDLRILLLADSHLGFDLPSRPRVHRRRRGHDFLANYAAALEPALAGEIDIVVHGGDVFDRSSVVPTLAYQAFEPLRRVADRGVPVFIVPGNHERSRLPHLRFASHPHIHIFGSPRTFVTEVRGMRVALTGFPYERRDVRVRFTEVLEQTAWRRESAALRLLCMHHCVERATVGPGNYTFTTAPDVIRLRQIPSDFAAVLSGHIHRHQVITADLGDRPIESPVLYPGSIERTSVAEIGEPKGFMVVHIEGSGVRWQFRELPARPMIRKELAVQGIDATRLASIVEEIIAGIPRNAVLSIRLEGQLTQSQWQAVSATRLRAFVPDTMNVEIAPSVRYEPQTRLTTPARDLSSEQLSFEV